MFEGLLELIKQRMAELGYTKYRFEPIRVQGAGGASTHTIMASNEYYYLVATTVPATLRIVSDTEVFTASDASGYANFQFYKFKEFSGNIRIVQGVAPIDLEFIRVIPE